MGYQPTIINWLAETCALQRCILT